MGALEEAKAYRTTYRGAEGKVRGCRCFFYESPLTTSPCERVGSYYYTTVKQVESKSPWAIQNRSSSELTMSTKCPTGKMRYRNNEV